MSASRKERYVSTLLDQLWQKDRSTLSVRGDVFYMLFRPYRMALFLAMFGLPCFSARWLWWCVIAGSVDRKMKRRRLTTVGRSSFSLTLPSRPASCSQVHSQSKLSSPNQTWDQIIKLLVVSPFEISKHYFWLSFCFLYAIFSRFFKWEIWMRLLPPSKLSTVKKNYSETARQGTQITPR